MGDIDKYLPTVKNIIPFLLHKDVRHDSRFKYTIYEPFLGEFENIKERDCIIFTDDMEEKSELYNCKKVSINSIAEKFEKFLDELTSLADKIILTQDKSQKVDKKLTFFRKKISELNEKKIKIKV